MSSVAPLGITSTPPPEIVPASQVIEPPTVRPVAMLRVPPLIANTPAMDDGEPIASEPFERSRADSLDEIVRLLTESAAEDE